VCHNGGERISFESKNSAFDCDEILTRDHTSVVWDLTSVI
jgi:hypothetical protein